MDGKIQKWGNSLALRIPKAFAKQAGLTEDCTVEISVDGDRIVVRAVHRPEYRLADLIAGITDENLHAEVDWGEPIGGESW